MCLSARCISVQLHRITAHSCLGCLSLSSFSVLFNSVLFLVVESCGHWCVTSLLFWLISHWFVVSFVSVFVIFCFFLFLFLFFFEILFAPVTVCAGGGFASPLPRRNRWSNVSL